MLPASYPLRNLSARPMRTGLTVSTIAMVVVASGLLLGLVSSMRETLVSTGEPDNLVVLRKGAENDGTSQLRREVYAQVRTLEGIATDGRGEPLVSPELVLQLFVETHGGRKQTTLIRGVEPIALDVHPEVSVVEGRMLRRGNDEVLLGRQMVGRFKGAQVGERMRFGRGDWQVVGVIESGGSSFESEIWADAGVLAEDARRGTLISGIRLRTRSPEAMAVLEQRIEQDPRFTLDAIPEVEYYEQQTASVDSLYALVFAVALFAGVGVGFGAANTMFAAVRSRRAEIGTLRALGFSRAAIVLSFQTEALLLAGLGVVVGIFGALGAAAATRSLVGGISFFGSTFTTSIVTLEVGTSDLVIAALIAIALGFFAGLPPAWRASKLRPLHALRTG